MSKIARSGSISQRYGSTDPDPYQNCTDPQHCRVDIITVLMKFFAPSPAVHKLHYSSSLLMVTGLSLTRVYLIFTLVLAELKNVDPVRSCGQVSQRVRLQHAQKAQDYRRLSRLCSLHWHFPGKRLPTMNHVQAPVCTVFPCFNTHC
jgi:hypothetical protein